MSLTRDQRQVLCWANQPNSNAIVWPIGADDPLLLAGMDLERRGYLESVQRSPEIWRITDAGREVFKEQP